MPKAQLTVMLVQIYRERMQKCTLEGYSARARVHDIPIRPLSGSLSSAPLWFDQYVTWMRSRQTADAVQHSAIFCLVWHTMTLPSLTNLWYGPYLHNYSKKHE